MSSIAVLGAGLLGAGFVEKLLERGETVRVYNRTASKLDPLVAKGAVAAATPAEAVRGAGRVHLVLSADKAVDSVIEQAIPALTDGVWVIDHSTNAPAGVAARHPRLRAQGVRYVHAPVFMGPANARSATGLMLLAASDEEAAELTPILSAMTGKLWRVGSRPDQAAVLKIMGNGMLFAMAGTMGDLLAIGEAQGLGTDDVIGLFKAFNLGGAIPSFGKRVVAAPTMDPSFELSMARKDVGLMVDAAKSPKDLVVLPAISAAMDRSLEKGLANKDFAIFGWPNRGEG